MTKRSPVVIDGGIEGKNIGGGILTGGFWEGWKSFARSMGGFQSRILMGLFYFFIVTPFGVSLHIFGDPLHLRPTKESSDWIPRKDPTNIGLDEVRKQF
jgi:hypothetical protein